MKRNWALGIAALTLAAAASAQPGRMGPGMMGWGGGWGGGPGGCDVGPGMMWGGGGFGMGPGMMGPGMMGGGPWGWRGAGIDLSAEQRAKIRDIETEVGRKQWDLMRGIHEQAWKSEPGANDEQAERRFYEAMAAAHKQMFENALDARKRIDAVLTAEQRERLQRGPGRR